MYTYTKITVPIVTLKQNCPKIIYRGSEESKLVQKRSALFLNMLDNCFHRVTKQYVHCEIYGLLNSSPIMSLDFVMYSVQNTKIKPGVCLVISVKLYVQKSANCIYVEQRFNYFITVTSFTLLLKVYLTSYLYCMYLHVN